MTNFKGPDGQEDMPYLLTPGPVTTSRDVKFAMLADWDPSGKEFAGLVMTISRSIKKISGCDDSYDCVILDGPGSSAIEAALGSFTPSKRKKTLIVANGPSGRLALHIMQRIGRSHTLLDYDETKALDAKDIVKALLEDRNITHVWVVHCETASGVVNPIAAIAREVKALGRIMIVDASATLGGVQLNMVDDTLDVLVSVPETCLEGIPGVSFVLAKRELLDAAKGECHSHVLDLNVEREHFESTGQFRFTPPTHVLVALMQALRELEAEGGVAARAKRYSQIADTVVTRMKALGFSTLLSQQDQGPIMQSILSPRDPKFNVRIFTEKLQARGFSISQGTMTNRATFGIGTIGKINEKLMMQLMVSIEAVMNEMGVQDFAPAGE
jgi:2-aminoethylphosphonate-pyruvate transaminase